MEKLNQGKGERDDNTKIPRNNQIQNARGILLKYTSE